MVQFMSWKKEKERSQFFVYGLQESNNTETKQRCEEDKVSFSETMRKSGIQNHQNEFLSVFRGEKIGDLNRPTVNKPSNKIKRDEIIQMDYKSKIKLTLEFLHTFLKCIDKNKILTHSTSRPQEPVSLKTLTKVTIWWCHSPSLWCNLLSTFMLCNTLPLNCRRF